MSNPTPIASIAEYHSDAVAALQLHFSEDNPAYYARFAGYLPSEISEELSARLIETDFQSSLAVLARAEAAFRIDYRLRCKLKHADDMSVIFRKIWKRKKERASLEDDILANWRSTIDPNIGQYVSRLKGLLKYRHWLAHGRYWQFSPKDNFQDIYFIVDALLNNLPLLN